MLLKSVIFARLRFWRLTGWGGSIYPGKTHCKGNWEGQLTIDNAQLTIVGIADIAFLVGIE